MELFNFIFAAIWFFLPAGIANATPVVAMHLPYLKDINYPLDFYKTWKGIRIFGDHKTFRGLISGMLFGFLTAWLQATIFSTNGYIQEISWLNYGDTTTWVLFGIISGAGALLGDAIKSFFKRRMNLKPGATWFPFDQIDYVLGGIFFTLPIIQLTIWQYLVVGIIYFILHPLATITGWLLKMKDSPL